MQISATGIWSSRSLSAVCGRNRVAGFTLVELLVVIVVLTLVSGLALPLLSGSGRSAEARVVRRLAGTVKHLYNEATLTRDEHRLVFDLGYNRLQQQRLTRQGDQLLTETVGRELALDPLTIEQIEVEGAGSFRSGVVNVQIFPLGWMQATRLLLKREDGSRIALDFSPLTGTVRIDEDNPQPH